MRSDGLMWHQLLKLSADSTQSLQAQLRGNLVSAILDGHIPLDIPLPSSRELAKQLGIARNTVVLAYQHLIDENYLISEERRGYFVNPEILSGRVHSNGRELQQDAEYQPGPNEPEWSEKIRVGSSSGVDLDHQRNITRPLDWHDYDFPFIYGQIDPELFPINDWRESCRLSLHVSAIREWSVDRVDHDDELLVEQIVNRILPRRGVWATPDQLLVTTGAQNALFLLAQLLLDDQSRVGMEDPCYADARNMFSLFTNKQEFFPVTDAGVQINEKVNDCDLLYVTPSHQCPTTTTLPLEKRQELLDAAVEHDFLVIEDDYESELNFVGEPTPALKSLDDNGRVIYVGSLSKTLAPGLRIGYMVASPELIRRARQLRRLMYRHPPSNVQRTVGHFVALGHHDSIMLKLARVFKNRWRIMDTALSDHLSMSSKAPAFGGSSFWVALPPELKSAELELLARQQGIVINSGDSYFASETNPGNFFRLGFSSIANEKIEPGIRALSDVVSQLASSSRQNG